MHLPSQLGGKLNRRIVVQASPDKNVGPYYKCKTLFKNS
jgi:hypothetical protein